ncbi:MAG: GTPase Era [Bacteroidia bacterium]|nr:GTPase Era [Bacteroidia bacterium]MCO5254129.1 GTPase Era [Bacteroidota bacterium]
MPFKSGFVTIIGRPNVGKSTIMNHFVGQKLSIVTPKASTTRHRITGVVTDENYQVVFSDTPGVIKAAYELHNAMMDFVWTALEDSDLVLYMLEVEEPVNDLIINKLKESGLPVLVLLNKIDLSTQKRVEERIAELIQNPLFKDVIPVSALYGFDSKIVLEKIVSYLPEGMPYFPDDQITDRTERFFVSEIIREQIFYLYSKEIPYSCEVIVEDFKEQNNIINIRAFIMVEREGQKGILVGKGGEGIKRVGTKSRRELETFLEKHVFLDLRVKVAEGWRKKELFLKRFGYKN